MVHRFCPVLDNTILVRKCFPFSPYVLFHPEVRIHYQTGCPISPRMEQGHILEIMYFSTILSILWHKYD